jgi:hypothetical protein
MSPNQTRTILVMSLLIVVAPLLTAQGRHGGGGAHGEGQYHGGRDTQQFVDRDGDGIDDRFQARLRQRQLRRLADAHHDAMNQALHLPPDAEIRLIQKAGDIPGLSGDQRQKLEAAFLITAPVQYSLEDGRQLTIFFTWSRTGGSLIRWYLLQSEGKTRRLEGKLLQSGLGLAGSTPDYTIPETIVWQPDPVTG